MKNGKRRFVRIVLFTLLFIILFLLFSFFKKAEDVTTDKEPSAFMGTLLPEKDSLPKTTTTTASTREAVKNTFVSTAKEKKASKSEYSPQSNTGFADTTQPSKVIADITPPIVFATPGPGYHDTPLEATITSSEPGIIQYRNAASENWQQYVNPFRVEDSLDIFIRAFDTAGNLSETIHRAWTIKKIPFPCSPGMVAVRHNSHEFCIDKYEWPNKKGIVPESYINFYAASDSCRKIGKRLCTSEEWELACGGSRISDYPYGSLYETRTCNTEETKALPSGSKEECRSPFGAYDLSGNLREWTSTKSSKNNSHYQVYGGYWANSASSKCNTTQYSFFPENKFIHIGFRCCSESR